MKRKPKPKKDRRDDGPDLVPADELLLDLAWKKVAAEDAKKKPRK